MLALNPIITKEKHLAKCEVISSGGSPISTQILQKLKQKCPADCELKDGYGMTEVPLITRTKQEGSKPGSAGKLVSNVMVKVVDLDTNKSVGPNESGECLVTIKMKKLQKNALPKILGFELGMLFILMRAE